MKSCDPSKFFSLLTAQRFARIYDKRLLGCKSEPISVRLLFSILVNLSAISCHLLQSHDFAIMLRSKGIQAFTVFKRGMRTRAKFKGIIMKTCNAVVLPTTARSKTRKPRKSRKPRKVIFRCFLFRVFVCGTGYIRKLGRR